MSQKHFSEILERHARLFVCFFITRQLNLFCTLEDKRPTSPSIVYNFTVRSLAIKQTILYSAQRLGRAGNNKYFGVSTADSTSFHISINLRLMRILLSLP